MYNDEQYRNGVGAMLVRQEQERREREQREREQRERERRDREQREREQRERERRCEEERRERDRRQHEESRKRIDELCRPNFESYSSAPPRPWGSLNFIEKLFTLVWNTIIYSAIFYFGGAIVLGLLIESTQAPSPLPPDCTQEEITEWENKLNNWETRKQFWQEKYNIDLDNVNRYCKILEHYRVAFGETVCYYWNCIDWAAVQQYCKQALKAFFDMIDQTPVENSSSTPTVSVFPTTCESVALAC